MSPTSARLHSADRPKDDAEPTAVPERGPAHRPMPAPRGNFAAQGVHWLLDFHGVAAAPLADADHLRTLLRAAATAAGARILSDHFHHFGKDADADVGQCGVTGVVLLAESHVTIHTWPEHGFAAVDLFLCGSTEPERAVACLERGLRAGRTVVHRQRRGTDAS